MKLGVSWDISSGCYYRAIEPMRMMEKRGHEIVWPSTSKGRPELARLSSCDLVHVFRRWTPEVRRILESLGQRGIAITWDTDDDLSAIPRESPLFKEAGGINGQRIHNETIKVAKLANVVTTTNEVLAQKYRRAGIAHVEIIDNYLPSGRRGKPRRHDGIVIGWIAGLEHNADAAKLGIARTLERLQQKHPTVRVECIGVNLGLPERYRHDPLVLFEHLPRRMEEFDIGIAPLIDIPFNRTRSSIKVKEYAASGVPWVASEMGPYMGLGERQGGLLVPDDGWYEALDELIGNPRLRRKLAKRGKSWAKTQGIDTAAERWERLFTDAVASNPRGFGGSRQERLARVS
jgi:glycosyltransferase involved in cell wall biosynthesis